MTKNYSFKQKAFAVFACLVLLGALLYAGPSIFSVYQGGTGASSFTAHGVLIGEGSSAIAASSAGTSGQCFMSNGSSSDPTFQTCGGGGGGGISVPTTFTAVNGAIFSFDTATLGETGVECFVPGNNTLNWRFCDVSLAAAPFTVKAQMDCREPTNANSEDCGLYLYDGTKLEGLEILQQATSSINALRVEHMSTVSTDTATLCGPTNVTGTMWNVKVIDNGTTRVYSYTLDGSTYTTFCTVSGSNYSFLTPNKTGFGGVSVVGNSAYVSNRLLKWSVTNP